MCPKHSVFVQSLLLWVVTVMFPPLYPSSLKGVLSALTTLRLSSAVLGAVPYGRLGAHAFNLHSDWVNSKTWKLTSQIEYSEDGCSAVCYVGFRSKTYVYGMMSVG